MTREEEISKALSKYVKNRGVSGNHIVDVERDAAFIAGVLYADRNPNLSSFWHDASEEPEHNCTIAYATKNNKIGTLKRADKSRWSWYMEKYSILMWAYVDDLLPKGGDV